MSYSTKTYPYDAVCYVNTNLGQGSGAIIGPHTILTCSHVLWDNSTLTSATSVTVDPGYNQGGTAIPGQWRSHFYEVNDSGDLLTKSASVFDFAIIDFAQDLSSYGSFGTMSGFAGGTVHVTGYPAIDNGLQTDETGTVSADPFYSVLDYGSISTSPGNSGGPLWVDTASSAAPQPGAPASQPYVVGIVSTSGWAVQLTAADWNTIQGWEQSDSFLWSGSTPPPQHIAPTVSVQDVSVAVNASIAAASIITGISNPSGDKVTAYEFVDDGGDGGHFVVNGVAQPDNQRIEVLTSNLSSIQYVGGPSLGSESLEVGVYDATTNTYSSYSTLTASTVSSFGTPTLVLSQFGSIAGGWTSQDKYPRVLADVNGDGIVDIVGFSSNGVVVSLATGNGNFAAPQPALAQFGSIAGGWTSQDQTPRFLADVNGDGKADIVGFSSNGVVVSLATGTGNFAPPQLTLQQFGSIAGGWTSQDKYPRLLADVNGDGKADIVGFSSNGVIVSLNDGTGHFAAPQLALSQFGSVAGGWTSQDVYLRAVADVNGDGKADIVGFSSNGVVVALNDGSGHFGTPQLVLAQFGSVAGGWTSQNVYLRAIADVNGDGKADIAGFSSNGVVLSLNDGSSHFSTPQLVLPQFGSVAGGWTSQDLYPRSLADVNGDGSADIVGFSSNGVLESLAPNHITTPSLFFT